MDEIRLKINGQEVKAKKGMTVLEAARASGIYIPTLCYHPDLEPYGGCRLCVVEIDKVRGLPTACTIPAADGMVVRTETEAVNKVRRMVMELLIAEHAGDCLTCPKNQLCEFQQVAAYVGITMVPFPKTAGLQTVDSSNPFFNIDRNLCILCGRCTRTCNEVTGVGAIEMAYRGFNMKVATFGDKPLLESVCKSCGECMAHCPTGAMAPKEVVCPTMEVLTTCPYCGVGCQMYLGVRDNKVVNVRGASGSPANNGKLCVKGRFGIAEFVNHPDRLTTPLIRRNGKLEKATWDEALDLIASKLSGYKPNEVALVSSAKCTNEDNYVIQKFGRVVLGTNSIDHCARL